jgi:hypothetical protein
MRKQANTCLRFFLPIHELARDRGPPSGKRGDAFTRCENAHVKIPLSANKTILRNPVRLTAKSCAWQQPHHQRVGSGQQVLGSAPDKLNRYA